MTSFGARASEYARRAGWCRSYVCDPNTVPERAIAYRQLNRLPSRREGSR